MYSENGLLIHPFWMTHNGNKHLKHYKEILESNRYKKLFILLPSLNPKNRKLLLSLYFENLVIYYLGLTRTMIPSIDIDSFEASIDDLVSKEKGVSYMVLRVIVKFLKAMGNDVSKYKNKHDRSLYICSRLISNRSLIIDNISDSFLKNIFYGDLWYNRYRNRYIKNLLRVKTKTTIIPLWYGGVDSFELLSFYNLDFDNINKIDIFGEYLNICVSSVSMFLNNEMNIETNVIEKDSILYNSNNNKDSKNYYLKNKSNRYLAVFNPSVEDDNDDVIYKRKYYGKRRMK